MKYRRVTREYLKTREEEDEKADRIKLLTFFFFAGTTILHAILILTIAFSTLIPTLVLIVLYISSTVVLYYYYRRAKIRQPGWRAYLLAPLCINLLLGLNYVVSWPTGEESYRFHADSERVMTSTRSTSARLVTQVTSCIVLEEDKYKQYFGIRIFSSIDKFRGRSKVTYTFDRGILGLRIMKDYKFE